MSSLSGTHLTLTKYLGSLADEIGEQQVRARSWVATTTGRYFDQSEMATYSVADSVSGDTFYVDGANGNDSYDGLWHTYTTGTTGPFKTLARAVYRYRSNPVVGGDVVKIKAGIYRESLSLAFGSAQIASLTSGAPLAFGPYGDGEVIIDPSPHPTSWTSYDDNIFYADWPNTTYPPAAVVLGGDFKTCREKQTLEELSAYGSWYFDDTAVRIYVNTGGVDPGTLDPVIPYKYRSSEQYAIKTGGYPYLQFYGLTARGAAKYGFSDYASPQTSTGVVLDRCTVKWNAQQGVRVFGSYGTVRKCHIWGDMLLNWPRGRMTATDGGWGQGLTMGGYGLAEGNLVHDNGGEGIGVYGGSGHVTIQDNIVYDNWSVGIYVDGAPSCAVQRNLVYAHTPDTDEGLAASWELPAWCDTEAEITAELAKDASYMRQYGIEVGDEDDTVSVPSSGGFSALDNIVVGCRSGIQTNWELAACGAINYTICGNTIILPDVACTRGEFCGISLPARAASTGTVIKNNLIYNAGPADGLAPLVHFYGTMTGVDWDHNLYYAVNDPTPFKSGSYPDEITYTYTNWLAFVPSGFDANSVWGNPLFTGTPGAFTANSYLLGVGSPAISAGEDLADISTDFNQFGRSSAYDIGALEYGSA